MERYVTNQLHVHEVEGSVKIADKYKNPHCHRFASVSAQAKHLGVNSHAHDVVFRTDSYEDHYHEFCGATEGSIKIGDKHVHLLEGITSCNYGHSHEFRVATLIEDPTGICLG